MKEVSTSSLSFFFFFASYRLTIQAECFVCLIDFLVMRNKDLCRFILPKSQRMRTAVFALMQRGHTPQKLFDLNKNVRLNILSLLRATFLFFTVSERSSVD